jgi:hypothetical protein
MKDKTSKMSLFEISKRHTKYIADKRGASVLKRRIKCSVCGKITAGRLPREGNYKGDGTFWYPRRHNVDGDFCPGNFEEGIDITFENYKNEKK